MIEIVPAVLSKDLAELKKKIELVASFAASAQIDVVDGVFDDDLTWPYVHDEQWHELEHMALEKIPHAESVFLEAHLMVQKPSEVGNLLIKAGVRRIIAHVEVFENEREMGECLHMWRVAGAEIGLAMLLDTPLERAGKLMQDIQVIQVMGIAAIGAQGHPFDPRALDRVREIRLRYPRISIEVDGGVTERTIRGLMLAGVNRCAVGSAIIAAADPVRAYHSLREAVA